MEEELPKIPAEQSFVDVAQEWTNLYMECRDAGLLIEGESLGKLTIEEMKKMLGYGNK